MFNASYVVPLEPRRYIPLFINAKDVVSICGLIINLSVDYAVQKLSNVPFRESDVSFYWEQLSGPAPLEFSNPYSPNPTIMLHPENLQDLKFRVWLDRGKEYEMFSDMWIYRTPTDVNATRSISTVGLMPLKANIGGLNTDSLLNSYSLVPTVSSIDIDSILDGELSEIPESYLININYPENFTKFGHYIAKVYVTDVSGNVIETVEDFAGNSISLGSFVPQFRLIWDVIPFKLLKGMAKSEVRVTDNELHLIPLDYYPNSARRNYFFTDLSTQSRYILKANTVSLTKKTVLPAQLSAVEVSSYLSYVSDVSFVRSASYQRFKAAMLDPAADTSVWRSYVNSGSMYTQTIKRFNDLNIGG